MLRDEAKRAAEMFPQQVVRRNVYQLAKADYNETPRKERQAFTIFERV